MPYREFQEQAEQCSICNASSVRICRRCGNPVCAEHISESTGEDPAGLAEGGARLRRAVRGVCLRCVSELEERIAGVKRERDRAQLARLRAQMALPAGSLERRLEFIQELEMDHAQRRRLRRLRRCFERERPDHLEQQREFQRRRVTVGICIACGEPASQTCLRCGTALCETHSVDQALGRCRRCEEAFRAMAGFEPDWLFHPLRALRYYRQRRRFMEQESWDPEVYRG